MLALPATVTIAEASDALRALVQAMPTEAGEEVTLDASGLVRFDTSALAVLLEVKRLAQAQGKRFDLVRAPARLAELAKLYGLGPLLTAAD